MKGFKAETPIAQLRLSIYDSTELTLAYFIHFLKLIDTSHMCLNCIEYKGNLYHIRLKSYFYGNL